MKPKRVYDTNKALHLHLRTPKKYVPLIDLRNFTERNVRPCHWYPLERLSVPADIAKTALVTAHKLKSDVFDLPSTRIT